MGDDKNKNWTKDDIISERLPEFEQYINELKDKPSTDHDTIEAIYQDFYSSCEQEAYSRNMDSHQSEDIDIDEIRAQAIYEEKNIMPLNHQWLNLFKQQVHENDVPGKILFRILLSALLKDIKFNGRKNKSIKPTLHFFHVQDPSSGKDEGLDFLETVVKEINRQYQILYNKPLIKLYRLSGMETVESLIDCYAPKLNKNGNFIGYDFTKIIPGLLTENDMIISGECSFLFREKSGDKQLKREILLQTLEGRPVSQSLRGWAGNKTHTLSNLCFIGVTRPTENMKDHIINSGLQQRAFNYCRDVDLKLREDIVDSMVKTGITGDDNDIINFNKQISILCSELISLKEWTTHQSTFTFSKDEHQQIDKLIGENLKEFYKKLYNNIYRNEQRRILGSFVGRFLNMIIILSYQNAILKRRTEVTSSDVQSAINAVKDYFDPLMLWVESKLEESVESKNKSSNNINNFKMILKDKSLSRQEIIKHLKKLSRHSEPHCYALIKEYLQGDNSLLIINSDKSISLRK